MKINRLKIDFNLFKVEDSILSGEIVTLITPEPFPKNNIPVKWTKDNLYFRSSLWNYEGELISAGFPKFFNWGEQQEISPVPTSLKNTTIVEKLDGSLLVLSKYKGNYILRTRGTVDASYLANGKELEIFKEKILNRVANYISFDSRWNLDTYPASILFEWVSPKNKIVLNYGEEPDWYLVGGIEHEDYSLWDQNTLNKKAFNCGLKRPQSYNFTNIDPFLKEIKSWVGKEGVCVFSKNDQVIHKVKSDWYLSLHHLKSELSSLEKVMDVWLDQGMPEYLIFYLYIVNTFDFELAEQIRGQISNICDAKKEVDKILDGMNEFIRTKLLSLPSRKAQAETIFNSYGKTNRASYIFKKLDNKPLEKEDYKKLIFQILKK